MALPLEYCTGPGLAGSGGRRGYFSLLGDPQPRPVPRNSCAKDLTSFAAEAIAMNRQLAQREEDAAEEEAEQGQPVVIRATSRCLQLSPPSQSKLAQRRQRASLSAAPVVLVGDHA